MSADVERDAIAAVRKWLAERERADRLERRYAAGPASKRAIAAKQLSDEARDECLAATGGATITVDGVSYQFFKGGYSSVATSLEGFKLVLKGFSIDRMFE